MKLLTKPYLFHFKLTSLFNSELYNTWSKYNYAYRAVQTQFITYACVSVICINLLTGLTDFSASYKSYGFVSFLALSVLLLNKKGHFGLSRWIFIVALYAFIAFLYVTESSHIMPNLLGLICFLITIGLFSREEKIELAISSTIPVLLFAIAQVLDLTFLNSAQASGSFLHEVFFINVGFILLSVILSLIYLFLIYEKSEQNLRILIAQLQKKEQEITLQNEELLKMNAVLTESQEELQKSHLFLNSVIDNLPLSLSVKDVKELKYVRINKAGENLLLYNQLELLNKKDSQIFSPEQAEEYIQEDITVLQTRKVIESEKVFYTKNKEAKILYTRKLPICDAKGEPMFLLSISEDITPRKQAEEVLKKTVKELQTRNHELDNYVYRVSHDLRAPFCSMQGLINLAKPEKDLQTIKQYIDLIENSVEKSDRFIQSILNHSKVLNADLTVGAINLEQIITTCFAEASYMKGVENIQLKLTSSGPVQLHSDEFRVTIILNNLINNAVKYMKTEAAEKYIAIDIQTSQAQSVISISDNGDGIAEEHLPKIFDMFFRGSEKATGSGLGLYIAQQAIEVLAGSITVGSKYKEGSTFTVTIPNRVNS